MLHKASIAGMTMDPASNNPIVILKTDDDERVIPIWIGLLEATSIASVLQDVQFERPMTHDLLGIVIREMGGEVESVVVSALEEGVFHATLHIAMGEKKIEIDCRPSDGIALAARSSSPLHLDESVLDAAGMTDLSKHSPLSVLWPVVD